MSSPAIGFHVAALSLLLAGCGGGGGGGGGGEQKSSSVTGLWVTAAGAACTNGTSPVPSASACEWKSCKEDAMPSTVFHVCDTGGDDLRSPAEAQSAATPWATWTKALSYFPSLTAGQAIAFCRGGSFTGASVNTTVWSNSNGTAASPIVVRDYTRPGREGMGDPRPIINGLWGELAASYSRWENLALHGGTTLEATLPTGSITLNGGATSHVNVCNVEYYQGPNHHVAQVAGLTGTDINFTGNRFNGAATQTYLGEGTDIHFNNNWFYNWGRNSYTFYHAIYWGAILNFTGQNETVTGNTFVIRDGTTSSVVTAHGRHSDMLIEKNTFEMEAGASAPSLFMTIGIVPGYGGDEFNERLVIRKNKVWSPGYIGIAASLCQDCLIENNLIEGDGSGPAIAFPYDAVNASFPTRATTQAIIRNNTVYRASGGALTMLAEGGPHIVQNNMWQTGATCLSVSGVNTSLFDYNGYHDCTDTPVGVSSWSKAPLFENPPASFRPGVGSPLIGSGNPAQSPSDDIFGAPRPGRPSIGAVER